MNEPSILVWIFGLITAVAHIVVFVCEAFLLDLPAVHKGVFGMRADDVPAARLWAWGVSFYNLTLGVGLIVGLVMWSGGSVAVGATLVVFTCILAVVAGLGLASAVLKGLYRQPRLGAIGALGQAAAPAITLIAIAAGW